MRHNKSGGFTLIELLIVIAIIGILAAVLIPNLMNARRSAALRATQAHSSNVYTALVAHMADSPTLDAAGVIAAASDTDCGPAGTVGGYGWNAAPANSTCGIAADGTTDFTVTTAYDGVSFINGVQQ